MFFTASYPSAPTSPAWNREIGVVVDAVGIEPFEDRVERALRLYTLAASVIADHLKV